MGLNDPKGFLQDSFEGGRQFVRNQSLDRSVELLERASGDVKTDDFGNSSLHISVILGRHDLIEKFLSFGADPNSKNVFGWSPMHCASGMLDGKALQMLKAGGGNQDAKDYFGLSVMSHAAGEAVVQRLAIMLCTGNWEIEGENIHRSFAVVGRYLYKISSVRPNKSKLTNDHLLELGVKAESPMINGALSDSATLSHVLSTLIGFGADISELDENEETLVHDCAYSGSSDVMRVLAELGANMCEANMSGDTPLHLAALAGHDGCVNTLIELGCNPNEKNDAGNTPLHIAVASGSTECASVLLKAGGNWFVKNKEGMSPMAMGKVHKREGIRDLVKEFLIAH